MVSIQYRRRLPSSSIPLIVWTFRTFVSLQSAGGRFRFLVPPSGTTCLSTSHLRRHSRFSDNSIPFCFPVPTKTLSYDSCVDYVYVELDMGPVFDTQYNPIQSGCRRSNLELSTGTHRLSSHVAVLQASLGNVFTATIFCPQHISGPFSDFGHYRPL